MRDRGGSEQGSDTTQPSFKQDPPVCGAKGTGRDPSEELTAKTKDR